MALTTVPYAYYPTGTTTTIGPVNAPYVYIPQPTPPPFDLTAGDVVRFRPGTWVRRTPKGPFRVIGWHVMAYSGISHLFLETIDGHEIEGFYPPYLDVIRDDFLTAVDRAKRESVESKE